MMAGSKKLYITGSAFTLAIILIVALAALPLISQIKISSQELAQKKQATESFYANWRNLENSKKEYQEIQSRLKELSFYLPSGEAIKFIQALEDFGQKTQNRENIFFLKNTASGDSAGKENTLNFQVSLWGSFPDLIKFLIYLENTPYYNNINSLRISRLAGNESASQDKETSGLPAGSVSSLINLSVYQK
ncbi:hypothetical protein KJ853_01520 [Patescibacteria group bacterium]|nr:hypothetical protein [Patescibacteria group bacterium]